MGNIEKVQRHHFVLVHGAWHGPWYWKYIVPILEAEGHTTATPNLPVDDPSMTLSHYASQVAEETKSYDNVVLVGHSRGADVIRVAARLGLAKRLVVVCSGLRERVPLDDQQHAPARYTDEFLEGIQDIGNDLTDFDKKLAGDVFYNECSRKDAQWSIDQLRPQRPTIRLKSLANWPKIPTDMITCKNDNAIPQAWQQYVAPELGITPIELEGDHTPSLSCPQRLGETLMELVQKS